MKLIVGLGNPGEKYINTRHNLGFLVMDDYRRKINAPEFEFNKKFNAEVSKVGDELILLKPQTFMNNSGESVASAANFYKISPEDVIIIHDELDVLLGHLKIRLGGGIGGHRGVESILTHLGTDQFIRLRLGVGNEHSHDQGHNRLSFAAEKFVLEQFSEHELVEVRKLSKKAIEALNLLLSEGLEKAQNQYH